MNAKQRVLVFSVNTKVPTLHTFWKKKM